MSRNVRLSIGLVAAMAAAVAVAVLLTGGEEEERGDQAAAATSSPEDRQDLLERDDSPRLSDGDQAVFVEFLDFECEACAGLHPTIQQLEAD